MQQLSDEVLLEAYKRAKQDSLNQDFILLLEAELKHRKLL